MHLFCMRMVICTVNMTWLDDSRGTPGLAPVRLQAGRTHLWPFAALASRCLVIARRGAPRCLEKPVNVRQKWPCIYGGAGGVVCWPCVGEGDACCSRGPCAFERPADRKRFMSRLRTQMPYIVICGSSDFVSFWPHAAALDSRAYCAGQSCGGRQALAADPKLPSYAAHAAYGKIYVTG
jgi:hypothetical protein